MKFLHSILILAPTAIAAFSVSPPVTSSHNTHVTTSKSNIVVLNAESCRRTLISNSFVATAAMVGFNLPAFAEEVVDDLAMPTEEEQAKAVSSTKVHKYKTERNSFYFRFVAAKHEYYTYI